MLSELLRMSRLNQLTFAGIVFAAIAWMSIISFVPIMVLRHFYIPESGVEVPVDFVKAASDLVMFPVTPKPALEAVLRLPDIPQLSKSDYVIDLRLSLPRNRGNRLTGNFVVKGELLTDVNAIRSEMNTVSLEMKPQDKGSRLAVTRMALLPFHTEIVEQMRKLLYLPLYILGLKSEESSIYLNLWKETKQPLRQYPVLLITISSDIWLSEATLIFNPLLSGIPWLLQTYPITSLVLGSLSVLVVEVTGALIAILYLSSRSSPALESASVSNSLPIKPLQPAGAAEASSTALSPPVSPKLRPSVRPRHHDAVASSPKSSTTPPSPANVEKHLSKHESDSAYRSPFSLSASVTSQELTKGPASPPNSPRDNLIGDLHAHNNELEDQELGLLSNIRDTNCVDDV